MQEFLKQAVSSERKPNGAASALSDILHQSKKVKTFTDPTVLNTASCTSTVIDFTIVFPLRKRQLHVMLLKFEDFILIIIKGGMMF